MKTQVEKTSFNLPEIHIKNLYEIQKKINHEKISEIFEFSREIKDFGKLCRGYEEKILIKEKNERLIHSWNKFKSYIIII